jgi:hypothetical protein
MLELTAPQIRAGLKSRHVGLGMTTTLINKSNALIEKALTGGRHRTREELIALFKKANIAIGDNRASHLFLSAELDGLVCSGVPKGNKQTFALLEERVPKTKSIAREEALERLAHRYFSSRYPVTLQDFIWWSGLRVGDAKNALDSIKSHFISETIGSDTYWLPSSFSAPERTSPSSYLLPGYDEYVLSYRDRKASIPAEHSKRTISSNGIFWPIIVINGLVSGLWNKTTKKDKMVIGMKFLRPHNKKEKETLARAAKDIGRFWGKELQLLGM